MFIEDIDTAMKNAKNVFVATAQESKIGVALARQGYFQTAANGDRFVVLEKGRRYEGEPGKLNYRIVEFERYGVKIDEKPQEIDANLPVKSKPTLDLLRNPNNDNLSELIWRIGLPLLAFNFVLIAIPLAYVNPRLGRYTPLIFAVLIYLTYSNLLNLAQAWVRTGSVSFGMGWWPIHALALGCAFLLFRFRSNRSAGWRMWFGERRKKRCETKAGGQA
jgi:lipopolysaccharide export system permease protein